MARRGPLYVLLVLGLVIVGGGIWFLLTTRGTAVIETDDNVTFEEDFSFRGKQVSLEEAGDLIGARVPLPSYLPEGYAVQEIYVGAGNGTTIMLISDGPIEKINRGSPDNPKDYPIYLVKCEMSMYVSFENDLRMIGGNAKPVPSEMVFDEAENSNGIWWTVQVDGETASLHLVAREDVAGEEELMKIARSVK